MGNKSYPSTYDVLENLSKEWKMMMLWTVWLFWRRPLVVYLMNVWFPQRVWEKRLRPYQKDSTKSLKKMNKEISSLWLQDVNSSDKTERLASINQAIPQLYFDLLEKRGFFSRPYCRGSTDKSQQSVGDRIYI